MVPIWYWIVSAILLIWNLIGCGACFSQLGANSAKITALPVDQRDAWIAMPATARIAYVVAVTAGLLGAVALLLRSVAAGPLFIASLIGVIVQFGWFFITYKGLSKLGVSSAAFPVFLALVSIGQIAFACSAKTQGWLA
jgi:hypothetical protein